MEYLNSHRWSASALGAHMKKMIAALLIPALTWQLCQAADAQRIISDLKVEVVTRDQQSPFLGFQTTNSAWHKICGGMDSYCGEPEGLAFAGPKLFVIVPIVGVADLVVGLITVPFDLIAAPFRSRRKMKVSTWTISATVKDQSTPAVNLPLKVVLALTRGASTRLGGVAKAQTDSNGILTVSIDAEAKEGEGIQLMIQPRDGDSSNNLKFIQCRDAKHPVIPTCYIQ